MTITSSPFELTRASHTSLSDQPNPLGLAQSSLTLLQLVFSLSDDLLLQNVENCLYQDLLYPQVNHMSALPDCWQQTKEHVLFNQEKQLGYHPCPPMSIPKKTVCPRVPSSSYNMDAEDKT
jgi:hypothetical protein